eukprot:7788051-Pyramimonas_sp.AAC.1
MIIPCINLAIVMLSIVMLSDAVAPEVAGGAVYNGHQRRYGILTTNYHTVHVITRSVRGSLTSRSRGGGRRVKAGLAPSSEDVAYAFGCLDRGHKGAIAIGDVVEAAKEFGFDRWTYQQCADMIELF